MTYVNNQNLNLINKLKSLNQLNPDTMLKQLMAGNLNSSINNLYSKYTQGNTLTAYKNLIQQTTINTPNNNFKNANISNNVVKNFNQQSFTPQVGMAYQKSLMKASQQIASSIQNGESPYAAMTNTVRQDPLLKNSPLTKSLINSWQGAIRSGVLNDLSHNDTMKSLYVVSASTAKDFYNSLTPGASYNARNGQNYILAEQKHPFTPSTVGLFPVSGKNNSIVSPLPAGTIPSTKRNSQNTSNQTQYKDYISYSDKGITTQYTIDNKPHSKTISNKDMDKQVDEYKQKRAKIWNDTNNRYTSAVGGGRMTKEQVAQSKKDFDKDTQDGITFITNGKIQGLTPPYDNVFNAKVFNYVNNNGTMHGSNNLDEIRATQIAKDVIDWQWEKGYDNILSVKPGNPQNERKNIGYTPTTPAFDLKKAIRNTVVSQGSQPDRPNYTSSNNPFQNKIQTPEGKAWEEDNLLRESYRLKVEQEFMRLRHLENWQKNTPQGQALTERIKDLYGRDYSPVNWIELQAELSAAQQGNWEGSPRYKELIFNFKQIGAEKPQT